MPVLERHATDRCPTCIECVHYNMAAFSQSFVEQGDQAASADEAAREKSRPELSPYKPIQLFLERLRCSRQVDKRETTGKYLISSSSVSLRSSLVLEA